jgi:hypothetical protein
MKIAQIVLTAIATLFGLLTIFVGTRVLLGADPGYVVFRPLLIYNTIMGFIYVVAGIAIWRNLKKGVKLAVAIFLLNLTVLVAIYLLYVKGNPIAVDSLRAMSLRTGVWLVVSAVAAWSGRRNAGAFR